MMIGGLPVPQAGRSVAFTPVPTELLTLLFNGANGSTTFIDSSPQNRTINGFGNAQISTLQGVSGGASLKLNGDPDYLEFTWNTPLFGNFDLSADLYVTGYSPGDSPGTSEIFSITNPAPFADLVFEVEQSLGNKIRFSLRNREITTYCDFYSNVGIALNTQTNVRAEVLNGTATIYLDGVPSGSAPVATTRIQSLTFARVGRLFNAGVTARGYTGFIDNLKITI